MSLNKMMVDVPGHLMSMLIPYYTNISNKNNTMIAVLNPRLLEHLV
jgi:hypothetical protein